MQQHGGLAISSPLWLIRSFSPRRSVLPSTLFGRVHAFAVEGSPEDFRVLNVANMKLDKCYDPTPPCGRGVRQILTNPPRGFQGRSSETALRRRRGYLYLPTFEPLTGPSGTYFLPKGWAAVTNLEETMKRSLLLICASLIAASAASAQTQPAQSGPNNNAVNSSGQNNSNAPVAGRNSFTEGQAKTKIEEAGYTKVSDLKKDDNGVLARQGE